ncbi:uridine kinase [Arsenicicoccus dermatophilus]|uniref:uridine kinase family protein n=1 Tax=Arsenicicoccus dermatophilus TaxID=1076331 RepID=UPI0039175A48
MSDAPAPSPAAAPGDRARVVVVCGPSGAGKSRLADRLRRELGWPTVRLDDFYRDGDDPGLPRLAGLGIPDWDDPRSWDDAAALDALEALCLTGEVDLPGYDIATSRRVAGVRVTLPPGRLVVAEGVFAAELVADLRRRGLLRAAWCVRRTPWITFALRLARDLHERRKPPLTLVRRGLALRRGERGTVAHQVWLGADPVTPGEAWQRARHLDGRRLR